METKALHPAMEAVDPRTGAELLSSRCGLSPAHQSPPGGLCDCKAKVARECSGTFSFAAVTVDGCGREPLRVRRDGAAGCLMPSAEYAD